MDRATELLTRNLNPLAKSSTPRTDEVKFTVTQRDVGTEAVRAGHMAEMEEQRKVLLVAAKLVLDRARSAKSTLDAISEFSLEAAVKMAEIEL
jgi:hypothetical protein